MIFASHILITVDPHLRGQNVKQLQVLTSSNYNINQSDIPYSWVKLSNNQVTCPGVATHHSCKRLDEMKLFHRLHTS